MSKIFQEVQIKKVSLYKSVQTEIRCNKSQPSPYYSRRKNKNEKNKHAIHVDMKDSQTLAHYPLITRSQHPKTRNPQVSQSW